MFRIQIKFENFFVFGKNLMVSLSSAKTGGALTGPIVSRGRSRGTGTCSIPKRKSTGWRRSAPIRSSWLLNSPTGKASCYLSGGDRT